MTAVAALLKERVNTGSRNLADGQPVYFDRALASEQLERGSSTTLLRELALEDLQRRLAASNGAAGTINETLKDDGQGAQGLKMPQIAMPLRVMVTGQAQTPSIDAIARLPCRDRCWRGCPELQPCVTGLYGLHAMAVPV